MSKKSVKLARIYQFVMLAGAFLVLALLAWRQIFLAQFWAAPAAPPRSANHNQAGGLSQPFLSPDDYPVMLTIDNSPEARPEQAGLAQALVVYETLVEGGATRLAALFAGAPAAEKIGPVRSARPYFVELAAGWGAFFWHAGGSPEALRMLKSNNIISLNEISGLGPKYLWRDASIARPHNLFTSGELVKLALRDFTLDSLSRDKLTWRWDEKFNDSDARFAGQINIDYSPGELYDATFSYDEKSGLYQRQLGGDVLGAANVIIQKIPAERYYPSGEGRLNLDLIGEGQMLLFRGGKAVAGRWRKAAFDSQTEWLDSSGAPLPLKPGQTWVEIVPGERAVSYD